MQQNNTSSARWRIYRGVKNIHEAAYVAQINGKSDVTVWSDEGTGDCTKIIGSDGMLIPPFRKKDEGLTFYARQICASIHLNFKRKKSFRGLHLHVFEFKFEELLTNRTCYCRDGTDCPPKGTMDIYPCIKAPVILSHPHFLYGDPSLIENVESSLSPDERIHEFVVNVELVAIRFAFCKSV